MKDKIKMKEVGQVVTLQQINQWKIKTYKEHFNPQRFNQKDGNAWWSRTKKNILDNTLFRVEQLPTLTR